MAHEASITEALVKMVAETASQRKAIQVKEVNLVVGELTGYMADSLRFYYDIYAQELPCKGARLNVEYVKPTMVCDACKLEFERQRFSFDCPQCGKPARPGNRGEEFFIRDLVIES